MIRLELISDEIMGELDRLSDGPTLADLAKFEIVLQNQFEATQRGVHKITRSLQRSGKVNSEMTGDTWQGDITYGGASTGIHNPVDYAEFERERDGNHDFLNYADALSNQYVQAMNDFLRG